MLFGEETGTYFMDATAIKVCHNKRRYRNKTFNDLAKQGKSSMCFFYGFKLHLIKRNIIETVFDYLKNK